MIWYPFCSGMLTAMALDSFGKGRWLGTAINLAFAFGSLWMARREQKQYVLRRGAENV